MRVQATITLCLGIVACLYGASSAVQGTGDPGDVLQKETPIEAPISRETVQTKPDYRDLRRQLMWDQVEWVEEPLASSKNDTLDGLIRQLQSLEVPQKPVTQEPNEPVPPAADAAPDFVLPEVPLAGEKSEKTALKNEQVLTLEKIDTAVSPLQLADVLYRLNYYELAFKSYCTAEGQFAEDENHTADHQWILFQKANCLRGIDLDEAIRLYRELINTFPNSKWAAVASSRLKMIAWSQANPVEGLPGIGTNDADR
ncbi:MAG: hypothetical protein OEV87_00200 [Phycisphaerae bacterium]|nr:hypothetical protein [Phycisphaerae bacterium]